MPIKKHVIYTFSLIVFSLVSCSPNSDKFIVASPDISTQIIVSKKEKGPVQAAIKMLVEDVQSISGQSLEITDISNSKFQIKVGTIGTDESFDKTCSDAGIDPVDLFGKWEAYSIKAISSPQGKTLLIAGSNPRGTAYGLMEVSRLIGVSPWVWWADAIPEKKESITLPIDLHITDKPSVKYRGIFLNDEDWGLQPWAAKTFEPEIGDIGPKTYEKIFQLLIRLKANTIWPAMHPSTKAFYTIPGNQQMAEKYQIFVGTSHAEPMLRNNVDEWHHDKYGKFDYSVNKEQVLEYWKGRIEQLTQNDKYIVTLGMRGIHDSGMQGNFTADEKVEILESIISDQRKMLSDVLKKDITSIPQTFVPYKEVLEIYKNGAQIPDDVTLMWTDDNYGYIKHFPDSVERQRSGGNGVYYHVSYWGRPHDYLWLSTMHPALVYSQLKLAYDKGAHDIWIINVGDIKPAEYITELAMDMAWDIDAIEESTAGLDAHLSSWLSREFGPNIAHKLLQVMNEYYRLAYIRKPEYMGNTRTEERDPKYKIVTDLPWSEKYVRERITSYESMVNQVEKLSKMIPDDKKSAWFELIEYPVLAAAEMNKKHLYGQLARHGLADWQQSDRAFENIVALTEKYNDLNDGKWQGMMDYQPRGLSVYLQVPHDTIAEPMLSDGEPNLIFNANQYTSLNGQTPVQLGLGYERGAIGLTKGSSVGYTFEMKADTLMIEVALSPNHPVNTDSLRYAISLNGGPEQIIDYSTHGRSETWKLNVLGNHAIGQTKHESSGIKEHKLIIRALDEGVIIDQIIIQKND